MRSSNLILFAFSLALITLSSCNDEEPTTTSSYTVPAIYAFQNVDYSGQTQRLNHLEEMMTYVEDGIESKTPLNAQTLKYMFENKDQNGGGMFSFSSSKMLSDKCFAPHISKIEDYFNRIESISDSQTIASNGVAGYSETVSGSVRLYDENGMELSEFIEKGMRPLVTLERSGSLLPLLRSFII